MSPPARSAGAHHARADRCGGRARSRREAPRPAPCRRAAAAGRSPSWRAAISAAVICAKSLRCSTSLPEKVKRASTSISGFLLGAFSAGRRTAPALTRVAAARGFCFGLRVGRHRRIIASSFSMQLARFQKSRKASSKMIVLVPGHEHRVQRPVEIVARADAGGLDRAIASITAAGPTGMPASRSARAK